MSFQTALALTIATYYAIFAIFAIASRRQWRRVLLVIGSSLLISVAITLAFGLGVAAHRRWTHEGLTISLTTANIFTVLAVNIFVTTVVTFITTQFPWRCVLSKRT